MTAVFPVSVQAETRTVRRGADLQAALNAAAPGDVLLLEAGAEYVGNFVLPVKSGALPIVLRTAPSDSLPPAGRRIEPSHAPYLATLRSPNTAAALRTAAGAHHWTLQYLRFAPNQHGYGDIVQLGDGSGDQNTLAKVPQNFLLTHLYIHGDPQTGQKRGIALNASYVTIRDSFIADIKGVGIDTQAIGGWNGPGPYVIENNYLEAAGENFLLGGADPAIPNLVATDVIFRNNHVARPFSWRDPIITTPHGVTATSRTGGALAAGVYAYRVVARRSVGQSTVGRSTASAEVSARVGDGGAVQITWNPVEGALDYRVYGRASGGQTIFWTVTGTTFTDTGGAGTGGAVPTSAGTVWSVKNLFELKNARSVVVEGNVFENHWRESQPGFAIVLTPRNSGGSCTWCVVEDVRFEHNIVRHIASGINLLGHDVPETPSQQTNRITFRNNLFYDMGGAYGGSGWFMQIGDSPRDLVIDHNTISHTGSAIIYAYGGSAADPTQVENARITNNAAPHANYGINGQYFSYGLGILNGYFPGAVVTANYLAGGSASRYPSGNLMAGEFADQFADAAAYDFRLRTGSILRGAATDGGDIGADMGTLLSRTSGLESGRPSAPPTPSAAPVMAPQNLRVITD